VEGAGKGESAGGEGGEGESEPLPPWAVTQWRVVRDRVRSERRRITGMARSGAEDNDTNAVQRLLELGAIPERVLIGRSGDDALGVQVRVEDAKGRPVTRQGSLPLREGQEIELLWGRVPTLARVLYAGLSPSGHASASDLALGLPGSGTPPDGNYVPPNTEAYPAEIVNLGPAIGIAKAVHRFSMRIHWSVEGQYGALAAFGPRRYQWDVIRLRTRSGTLARRGDERHSGRGEAAGAELREGFREIGEDTEASVHEEIIDPATAALMVTDAGIRSIGTVVGSFVSLVTQPSNEQGIHWEGPGTYVVRCITARPPLQREDAPKNAIVRAPSVAILPIRVMTAQEMATRLTTPTDLRQAEAELAELRRRIATATDEERPGLEQQVAEAQAAVARLPEADQATMTSHLDDTSASIDEQLALAELLVRLRATNTEPLSWLPQVDRLMTGQLRDLGRTAEQVFGHVVGLHVQLNLAHREPETLTEELRRSQEQVRQQRSALAEVAGDLQGPAFRPHMAFVPRMDGRSLPLTMVLSEARGSGDGRRHWTLVDLSTPGHHDSYEGRSSGRGAVGHADAIRAAIRAFVGGVPYGRGTVAVRLPEAMSAYVGGPVDVPQTSEARPNADARWRQRLESLATAAGTAALLVTGPAGVAIGVIGAVAGGTVAAYRIHRRYVGGYLELDLATAMDVTAIVGAVVARAGAWAGGVRGGSRWVTIADRVETGSHVFGYLQVGSQVFVIPITFAQELQAIGENKDLSPGERAAWRAMAFLNATRSGLELAISAEQVISEHAAGPRERTPRAGTAEGGGGSGAGEGGRAAGPRSSRRRPRTWARSSAPRMVATHPREAGRVRPAARARGPAARGRSSRGPATRPPVRVATVPRWAPRDPGRRRDTRSPTPTRAPRREQSSSCRGAWARQKRRRVRPRPG
jgi:hypothetical protein